MVDGKEIEIEIDESDVICAVREEYENKLKEKEEEKIKLKEENEKEIKHIRDEHVKQIRAILSGREENIEDEKDEFEMDVERITKNILKRR